MSHPGRLPDPLIEQLQRLKRRLVGNSVLEGTCLTIVVGCLSLATVLLLDLFTNLPVTVRAGLLFAVPTITVLMFCWSVLWPLFRRYQQSELAAVVEVAHPELRERLISSVEFAEQQADGKESESPLMQSLLLQQTIEFANQHDFTDVIDSRRAIRRCWMSAASILALLVPLLIANQAYAALLARFIDPWGDIDRVRNLILTVDEGDRTIGRGDDLTIVARPSWRIQPAEIPTFASLNWVTADGEQQSRRMDWNEDSQTYAVQLNRITSGFRYRVSAQQSRSQEHRIDVVDRPVIRQFIVDVVPPAYTGDPAEHHDPLLGEVVVVEQSRLDLQLAFAEPVTTADLLWLDGPISGTSAHRLTETVNNVQVRSRTPLSLSDDGRKASLKFVAAPEQPSGRFIVRVRDAHQLTAQQEQIHRLTVRPDVAPAIAFTDRETHPEARPHDIVRFPIQASDDYGLTAVELHYEWTQNSVRESIVVPVPSEQIKPRNCAYLFEIDLSQHALPTGTQISLRARAVDNRPIPGPNESWTSVRQLQIKFDAKTQGDQALAERQHRTNQAIDELQANLEKQRQAAKQLQNQAQADAARKSEWQKNEAAAELEQQIQQLTDQLQKLSAVMEQQPVFEHLAQRAQQIGEQSLAQAKEKVNAAQAADLPQKQQMFSDAANNLQKAEKELEQVQKEFQELSQLQRDLLELNRIADQTEKLAGDVDLLTDSQKLNHTSSIVNQQWQQDHRQLVSRHRQLEGDLDTLLEKHPDLMDKARETLQQNLVSLAEQAEQLARQQSSLANAARNEINRNRQTWQPVRNDQEKLLQGIRQLAEELNLPGKEELQVNGAQETRAAAKEVEQGNLQAAQEKHRQAESQLKQLARALEDVHTLPMEQDAAVKAIQERQAELEKQISQLPEAATPESEQQMTDLAGRQVALQRAISEIPKSEALKESLQQTLDAMGQTSRALAENRPQAAKEQSQTAADALQQLQEKMTPAAEDADEPPAESSPMADPAAQKKAQQERQRTQELQQKATRLAEEERKLAEQLAGMQSPTPPAPPAAEGAAEKSAVDAMTQLEGQEQLTQSAKELGSSLKQLGLKDAAITKKLSEFPDAARQAAESLQQMNIAKAVESSSKAAEKARQLADALNNPDGPSVPERLQQQAEEAANQQQQLAQQMKDLAANPAAQQQLRDALHQRNELQTELLKQELSSTAKDLALDRINRPTQSDLSQQAAQQVGNAEQLQQQSQAQRQSMNQGTAAQKMEQSAEPLRRAAHLARQASEGANPKRPPETTIPGEVGRQVAESSQQLSEAGHQLSQLQMKMAQRPGTPESNSQAPKEQAKSADAKDGSNAKGEGEGQSPGEGKSPESAEQGKAQEGGKSPSGESPSQQQQSGQQQANQQQGQAQNGQAPGGSETSLTLREAAQGLRSAAKQMGLSMNNKQQGDSQSQSGQESQQSTSNDASNSAFSAEAHLQELEHSFSKLGGREWGKLPGQLQTEMIESSQRPRDPTYRGLIRKYFEDISKARPPELDAAP